MNTLFKTFLTGLLAFLPVFLTVYAVYYFADWLNRMSSELLLMFAPDLPAVPGLGIAVGVTAIFVLGLLVSSRLTRWIYQLVEIPLSHLPVIKDLYLSLKQFMGLLAHGDKGIGQVVSLKHPDHDATMVGLLMRSDVALLDDNIASGAMVAVYLPLSYQIGGYTLFVPRAWVTPVDMTVESAMRNALTGWVPGGSNGPAGDLDATAER